MKTIIYLHGFNSAFDDASTKVLQLRSLPSIARVVGINFNYHHPDLLSRLDDFVLAETSTSAGEALVAGTSLGGFFARYIASRFNKRVIAINPSLTPWTTLARAIGVEHTNFKTGEKYTVTREWVESLQSFRVEKLSVPALTVIASDDELLHFTQEMIEHLKTESEVVMTVGGHRLETLPPTVMEAIATFIDRDVPK